MEARSWAYPSAGGRVSQAVTSLLELWEGYTLVDSTDAAYSVFYPVMLHGSKYCDIFLAESFRPVTLG